MATFQLPVWWRRERLQRHLLVSASFCVAYVGVAVAMAFLGQASFVSAPWRPQSALAIVLVAVGGIAYAPAVVVAVFAAEWLTPVGAAAPLAYFALCTAVAAIYCAAGWSIGRWTAWSSPDVGLKDLSIFVAIAIAAGILLASVTGTGRLAASALSYARVGNLFRELAVGHLLGLIVLGPILMQAAAGALRTRLGATTARSVIRRDQLLFLLAMVAVLAIVFRLRPFDEFRMFYLMFLPMIAVAMRYGLAGAALALPIVQIGLIVALALFAPQRATGFEFQLLMLALALTSLYLGTVSSERERVSARWARGEQELRRQRQELSEAQRAASTAELAAAVAHDLNQPLSAIGTYAQACRLMIERGETDRAVLLRTLDQLAAESARAGQYVRRMRDFFRTGSTREDKVDIKRLVDTAHAHLQDRLQRLNIAWNAAFDPRLPAARADAVQLGAILDNMLANACDAMQASATARVIRVTAARVQAGPRPLLRVCVEDSGPGVPAEFRDQLFKPLATTKPHGMGLGLALSRSIAERMGGRLWFDAERPHTTFCLEVPADE